MATTLNVPLQGPSVNIVKQYGPTLSDILKSKFGCVATIEGVDCERDAATALQKRPTVVTEKRFTCTLRAGVKMSVWKGDLTNMQVDAVVNAANVKLRHYSGLAFALSSAGGPQIQGESDMHIKQHGALETGDAVVCNAGLLPCKKIIHAVGPCLPPSPSKSDVASAEQKMKKTIKSILDRVQENSLKTVAIPAISSGLFNYPLTQCANTIVSAVKEYYDKASPKKHRPDEVLLVNNDEPSVKEMERACHDILTAPLPKSYSKAAAARNSPPAVRMGHVHLTLQYGKIEEQQTDVIVNTASADLDLRAGAISKAILRKAGSGIQQELYGASQGLVIMTGPHYLQCKAVYHTFCPESKHADAKQILYNSVWHCLWMAVSDQHKSVALPAIGTGGLGFSKKLSAQIMLEAVLSFAMIAKHHLEVNVVIFPNDKEAFQAFEEEMKSLQRKASDPIFTQDYTRDYFHDSKPPTPKIILNSPSEHAAHEAGRWLSGLFNSLGTVTICNNFIQHFGENEHREFTRLMKKGVFIEESFKRGHVAMKLCGGSHDDVVVAGLQVEAMLCNIQREFLREESGAMSLIPNEDVLFQRTTVDQQNPAFVDRCHRFKKERLLVVKLETVENAALKRIFEQKKKQIQCNTHRVMYQRIRAQFCEMVGHIGFHAECAPPADPAYGEGIYFTDTVRRAMEVWTEQNEEYLYFVEAEVLTGNATPGRPGLILPPAMGTNPQSMYDSVSGGPDIAVIFSTYQALPRYIITCKTI